MLSEDAVLAGLVEKHGAKKVFETGMRVLGQPVWMPSVADAILIQTAIEKGS